MRRDTTITIDAADYLDFDILDDPIAQADRRELLRLLELADEARRALRGTALGLSLADCLSRLEPMRRRFETEDRRS